MNLDSLNEITKLDKDNMLELLTFFPKQCNDALFIGENAAIFAPYKKTYSHIVFTGLGGSAIGADIIKEYLADELNIPFFVNRDYTLPQFVGKNTLVFAVSYSGNTEETLSAYVCAKEKGASVVVVTSGGELEELALKNKDMLVVIPKGYPPRCALGYSFIPSLLILSKLGLIKDKKFEVKKAVESLDALRKKNLEPGVNGKANISKAIARAIHDKFPVVYASAKMGSIATRWRGQFAENSKTLGSAHVFPEMNHNEIVGWAHPKELLRNFTAILLKDKDDHPRIQKRMDVTKAILKKDKFHVLEVESKGQGLLERMLSLIYIGDFASFYLSILNKVDPTPVDRIAYLKKELGRG